MRCLKVDLHQGTVEQDGRDALHEELGQPVSSDVLFKEGTYSPSGCGNETWATFDSSTVT